MSRRIPAYPSQLRGKQPMICNTPEQLKPLIDALFSLRLNADTLIAKGDYEGGNQLLEDAAQLCWMLKRRTEKKEVADFNE